MHHANISSRLTADLLRALVIAALLGSAIPASVSAASHGRASHDTASHAAANPRSQTAAAQKHTTDPCTALAKEIAGLDARMRAGYGGKAGERMRDRQREAVDEYHRLRCRRM